jgi:hypothetical protein
MGIEFLSQRNMQNAGLAGSDRLARNAMFPQSQMDKTQYAVSSQMPTSAEIIRSDYDTPTNAYTGLANQTLAQGGIAALRYDNGGEIDPKERLRQLSEPAAPAEPVAPPTMAELASQLNEAYRSNSNYDDIYKQFAATKEQDPAEWYRNQLGFLGGQQGWQIGQNRGDRLAAFQPQVNDTIAQAQAAGLSPEEIEQILSGSSRNARNVNVQRIATQAAEGGGMFPGISGMVVPAATIAAMAAAPYLAPMLAPTLGTFGATLASGALTGGALGGIGAGVAGKDIGRGALMGGVTGAAGAGIGGALSGIDPSLATGLKSINAAKNVYNFTQNPTSIGAGINAARGAYQLGNTMMAAKGGLMASGGIADLGSYSDGGRLLKGPGDGMSDHIPATIGNKQPARLAEGEFVIPADVVSHLGNGSTDAGAKQLYKMMDNIRRARTGNPKQGKQINPAKFTPKG